MPLKAPCIKINGRRIGPGNPTYVIAEMSCNHNGDYRKAAAILHAAKDAGADAVKLQTYTPGTMTLDSTRKYFRIRGTLWKGRKLYDLYKEAMTPWEWHPKLRKLARKLGLDLFSSPFDNSAVDFLERMGVPAYKVASFECIDIPLLKRIARTGKPVIVSTGMTTRAEIEEAVDTLEKHGAKGIALLKCTSAYPAPPEDMNLRTIPDMIERFRRPVGLSDHTTGVAIPAAAVALGASIVEKHLTLSRKDGGPDSAFSLEPGEFKIMVAAVRTTEKSLGSADYRPSRKELASRALRRSLFVVQSIKRGDIFSTENVRSIRPGHGLHPRYFEKVLGLQAARHIQRGTPLTWNMIAHKTPS